MRVKSNTNIFLYLRSSFRRSVAKDLNTLMAGNNFCETENSNNLVNLLGSWDFLAK